MGVTVLRIARFSTRNAAAFAARRTFALQFRSLLEHIAGAVVRYRMLCALLRHIALPIVCACLHLCFAFAFAFAILTFADCRRYDSCRRLLVDIGISAHCLPLIAFPFLFLFCFRFTFAILLPRTASFAPHCFGSFCCPHCALRSTLLCVSFADCD